MPLTKNAHSAKPANRDAKPANGEVSSESMKALAGNVLKLSVEVEPLMNIVRQHVRDISPATVRAIKLGFVEALRVTTPLPAARAHRPKRAAATETVDPVLSSQQAADLVGVSRPYMVARIDAGDVKLHQQVGNQRRVLRSSVVAWHKRERARQRRALAQLGASLDDEIFSD